MNRNDVAFFCRVDDLKTLIDLISCLYMDISKDTECDIEVTPESFFLRVMGKGRNCQGRISVGLPLFREFYCDADGVVFSVSLAVLVDCLKLFGAAVDSTSATLSFSRTDAVLKVSLEETGLITICEISTLHTEDSKDEETLLSLFRRSAEKCQVIFRSDPLKEAIQELADSLWLDSVECTITNDPQEMRLSTGGVVGTSEVLFPGTADVFVAFRCFDNVREVYPIRAFLLTMKALSISKESFVRINGDGVLCAQHQVESKRDGVTCYVDFILLPEQ
eukprot:gene3834-2721_t